MFEPTLRSARHLSITALLALIGGALWSSSAGAAGWDFSKEISCSESPVSGIATGKCWISQERRDFRSGVAQAWKQAYSDSTSEFAIGYYKVIEHHGSSISGFAAVTAGSASSWIQNADALQAVVSGGSNWQSAGQVGSDFFVSFTKKDRQCIAFVRNGVFVTTTTVSSIIAGAFCRSSAAPLSPDELKFFLQGLQIKS